jgi:hypothetical protein
MFAAVLPSSGLDHVGTFSTQTTQNCQSNSHLALCLQVLLALVALACVVLAEPQGGVVYQVVPRPRYPIRYYTPYNPTLMYVSNRRRPIHVVGTPIVVPPLTAPVVAPVVAAPVVPVVAG